MDILDDKVDNEIRSIITHSLGLDWEGTPYRNRYCSDSNEFLEKAVELGLMKGPRHYDSLVAPLWHVTEKGAEYVNSYLPA